MRLSQYTLDTLRHQVEQEGGFQVAITPVYPRLFEKVRLEADALHDRLEQAGYRVLLDDRNQKPRNMFEVVEFLGIPHRLTLSGRSLEVGVYEYFNTVTQYREKVSRVQVLNFFEELFA